MLSRYLLLKSWTALCPAGDRAASNSSLSFAKRKGLTFGLRDAFCNFAGFLHDLAKMGKKWTSIVHPGVTLIACLNKCANDPKCFVSEATEKKLTILNKIQQSVAQTCPNLNKQQQWESCDLGFHPVPLFPFNTSQTNGETCEGVASIGLALDSHVFTQVAPDQANLEVEKKTCYTATLSGCPYLLLLPEHGLYFIIFYACNWFCKCRDDNSDCYLYVNPSKVYCSFFCKDSCLSRATPKSNFHWAKYRACKGGQQVWLQVFSSTHTHTTSLHAQILQNLKLPDSNG